MFAIVQPDVAGAGPVIPVGRTGEEAPTEASIARGRPTRIIRPARVDAATTGALFMRLMPETMIAARMSGVNACDRPAVEHGRVRTREIPGGR